MSRVVHAVTVVLTGLLLAGCFSGEPAVSENEQVSAEQRAAMEATEGGAEGGGGEGGGAAAAEWVAIDIAYESAPTELPAGPLTATLVNNGSIEHNVVIEERGDEVILEAAGGASDQAEVEFEPGEYTYYCSIPGHREAGMEGTLTVTG